METGESLLAPKPVQRHRTALRAEAKGVTARRGRDSGKSRAVGNGRATLSVAPPRPPVGAGETCAPRICAGDRAAPAGRLCAEPSAGEGHDPG